MLSLNWWEWELIVFLQFKEGCSYFNMSILEICSQWKVLPENQIVNCALAHKQESLCLRNKLGSDPESIKLPYSTLPFPLYWLGTVLLRVSQFIRLQLCWCYKDTTWFLFLQRFLYLKMMHEGFKYIWKMHSMWCQLQFQF